MQDADAANTVTQAVGEGMNDGSMTFAASALTRRSITEA
jgi:hypothetical protein